MLDAAQPLILAITQAAQAQAKQDSVHQPPPQDVPEENDSHRLARWAMILGGQGLDAGTSIVANRDPRFRETNPLYGDTPSAGRIALTKALVTGGGGALMDKVARTKPKTALVGSALISLAGLIPGILNLRTLARAKKD